MKNFIDEIIAEFHALGSYCVVHGPEIWIALAGLCSITIGIVLGMWLAARLSANDDNDKDDKD